MTGARFGSSFMSDEKQGRSQVRAANPPPSQRTPASGEREWEQKTLAPALEKSPDRAAQFTTISGYPIRRLYTQADLAGWSADRDLGMPGEPPFTRGIHPSMYR